MHLLFFFLSPTRKKQKHEFNDPRFFRFFGWGPLFTSITVVQEKTGYKQSVVYLRFQVNCVKNVKKNTSNRSDTAAPPPTRLARPKPTYCLTVTGVTAERRGRERGVGGGKRPLESDYRHKSKQKPREPLFYVLLRCARKRNSFTLPMFLLPLIGVVLLLFLCIVSKKDRKTYV